jgi:SRSO17 transposase
MFQRARFGCVLADSGCGSSGSFRQALSERGLLWAAGPSRRQNVYFADVALIFPVAKAGRPGKYNIPDQLPVAAEALLAGGKWRRVSWRRRTKGRLTCLFVARRVRIADGHKHRMIDNRMQCMPGEEVWLVGERRSTGEKKYYVSNLPANTSLKTLAATIKARWVCEQAHPRPGYTDTRHFAVHQFFTSRSMFPMCKSRDRGGRWTISASAK